jgi:hypothetical protein
VMGGTFARAQQWESFREKFDEIRQRYGFRVFHTIKFKRRSGDFVGWSREKCLILANELAHLTNTYISDGCAVSLINEHYKRDYVQQQINEIRWDSKYGLCFRISLLHFISQIYKRKYRGKFPLLHIVLEAGHKNYGDAERIFFEVKKEFGELGFDSLRTISKMEKDQSAELMIADFVAHTTYQMQSRSIATGAPMPPPDVIPKGYKSIAHYESTPEGLETVRGNAIALAKAEKARKQAAWRKGSSRKAIS